MTRVIKSEVQVESAHYSFEKYITKRRWMSIWSQLAKTFELKPEKVLEIGVGSRIYSSLLRLMAVDVKTLDIDPSLTPDYLASCMNIPLGDSEVDLVCSFQVLEHLPFEDSLKAFSEMARVSKGYVLISLPNAKKMMPFSFHIPKFGDFKFFLPKPYLRLAENEFDGQHYWEINKKGFKYKYVLSELLKVSGLELLEEFRVKENPYHHFFLFRKG